MFLSTRASTGAVLAAAALTATLAAVPSAAFAGSEYVKYYTVTTSYHGAAENLTEIAQRFLGNGKRSTEVFNLNVGRPQPDGEALVNPAKLAAGWTLMLPWDAVGTGVNYGLLPEDTPGAQITPAPARSANTTPDRATAPVAATPSLDPASVPPSGSAPAPRPSTGSSAKSGGCAGAAPSGSGSTWAQLRLAADQAWPQSRGKGQLVAVVDSGADGSLPQLTGHVSVGADIVGGSGRGDTDCLGTGTAMAGLIVAQQNNDGGPAGIAPDATVMPIRVTGAATHASPADAASAIRVATDAGATVIALGPSVDAGDASVSSAMHDAVAGDVVVVVAAAAATAPAGPEADVGGGLLRTAGIGVDGDLAGKYRAGGVDLVAPGANVTSLGITGTGTTSGTGTHYAVAFVAGEAALVRAAYPELSAAQVAHRIEVTADPMGEGSRPDSSYGWGLMNPAASVTKVLPEENATGDNASRIVPAAEVRRSNTALLTLITVLALGASILLVLRLRRLLRPEPATGTDGARPGGDAASGSGPPPPAPPPPAPPTTAAPPANGGPSRSTQPALVQVGVRPDAAAAPPPPPPVPGATTAGERPVVTGRPPEQTPPAS
ncbi:S8 family serine peptidase [Mangrovihabitans endophyticus]|nr:S8 family serine peptidase [Mangrovihabitans endophyticus]